MGVQEVNPNQLVSRAHWVLKNVTGAGLNTWGVKNNPTNPLRFEVLTWRCEGQGRLVSRHRRAWLAKVMAAAVGSGAEHHRRRRWRITMTAVAVRAFLVAR